MARLRTLADDGWTHQDLATAFGITPQHVGRLVRGEQRPDIGAPDDAHAAGGGGVTSALAAFLDGRPLDHGGDVYAAVGRSLAQKIDACAAQGSATSAQASARLTAGLVSVLDRLRDLAAREPDIIDQIADRRRARITAARNRSGHET